MKVNLNRKYVFNFLLFFIVGLATYIAIIVMKNKPTSPLDTVIDIAFLALLAITATVNICNKYHYECH